MCTFGHHDLVLIAASSLFPEVATVLPTLGPYEAQSLTCLARTESLPSSPLIYTDLARSTLSCTEFCSPRTPTRYSPAGTGLGSPLALGRCNSDPPELSIPASSIVWPSCKSHSIACVAHKRRSNIQMGVMILWR